MWILNQKKDSMHNINNVKKIKITQIVLVNINGEQTPVYRIIAEDIILGEYEDKKRANKIFIEIFNTIKFGGNRSIGQKETTYEMPEK